MSRAPYYPIATPVPAWGRLIEGSDNRNAFQIDARGSGLIGGFRPQTLIPHGETVSLLSSAMIQNSMSASNNGFEGISVDLQGFRRGPTGSAVRVWRNDVLVSGDPDRWITEQSSDYRRVTFIDQMPENISPEWIQSTWFTKGTAGQTNFANLEFRDHYSRRYKRTIGAAQWTSFQAQINTAMIAGRDIQVQNRYLDTIVTKIAKGQSIAVDMSTYIISAFLFDKVGSRLPMNIGIALKLTRQSDGGADWWGTSVATSPDSRDMTDEIISKSETFVAKNAYRQVEPIMWLHNRSGQGNSSVGPIDVDHAGIEFNFQINDSVETG